MDEHPVTGRLLVRGVAGPGEVVGLVERGVHGGDAAALPCLPQRRQLPRAGGEHRDPARPRAPDRAAHEEQPGVEDRRRVGPLHVLEEGRVDRPGRVVDGEEDDAAAGADRRGLGGDLDPGDEDLRPAAYREHVAAAGHAERVEHRRVEVHDVSARVEPEDVELGPHLLGRGHLRQADPGHEVGLVAEVEGDAAVEVVADRQVEELERGLVAVQHHAHRAVADGMHRDLQPAPVDLGA